MAHFAEIDTNNIVTRVLVVANDLEHRGAEFLAEDLGLGGTWIQTSFNGKIRKNFAGVGFTYDPVNDWFYCPQPYASWTLNDQAQWEAPIAKPEEGSWAWDEELGNWVEAEII